jgi:hypothetical protein
MLRPQSDCSGHSFITHLKMPGDCGDATTTSSSQTKTILGSEVRSTCCPPGRPSFKSLHNRGAPALTPLAREDAPSHGTSNTSNQWKKMSSLMSEYLGVRGSALQPLDFSLMSEYLGVRGSALQPLDFDDVYEELLLLDEEDFVAALQGAPARTDVHSDAPSITEEAGSECRSVAVSVDWDE